MRQYRKKDPKKKAPAKRRKGHFFLGPRTESKLLTPDLLRVGTSEERKNKKTLSISRVEESKGEENLRGHSGRPHMVL